MDERHVVLVTYDGVQPLDVVGPHEVFCGATRAAASLGSSGGYRVTVASLRGGPVRSESGIELGTVPLPESLAAPSARSGNRRAAIDTLVLAGGTGVEEAAGDEELVAWVRGAAVGCRRVATVCSGTFLAAAAGLLEGRRVTTHWARAAQLGAQYPSLHVDPDPIYVRDGRFWSSAGVTAGIDLSLALVEEDLGVEVAQTVARWLVMFLHRPGGQTQFASPVWVPRAERSTIRAVQSLVESAPGGDHRIPALAAAAAMSVRHFTRVFVAEVGETPSRFVERARVQAARPRTRDHRRHPRGRRSTLWARQRRDPAARVRPAPRRRTRRLPPALPHRPHQPRLDRPRPDRPRLNQRGRTREETGVTHPDQQLEIAIPLFDRCTALDAVGPYEVLQRIPTLDVTFVGARRGEVRTENRMLGLVVDATFEERPAPDVIVFPGGVGTRDLEHDEGVLAWLRHAHGGTRFTTSVCTGSLVLGAAGLLDGLSATTHWSCYDELAAHGAEPTAARVVEHLDRRIITAAGVSSGIDMALRLAELLVDRTAAEAAQLMIEYDPQPPFDCGSLTTAPDSVVTRVVEYASQRQ